VNEYSEYMQYINSSPSYNATTQQSNNCVTGPTAGTNGTPTIPLGASPFGGCNPSVQYYDYIQHVDRWSNELRLQSKPGGRLHWSIGAYWEKTRDIYSDYFHMPGLQSKGQAWQYYASYYGIAAPPAPDDWYSYTARSDYLQVTEFTNEVFDITPKLHLEVGTVHFQSHFSNSSYGGFWNFPQSSTTDGGSSNKWNSKVGLSYKPLDSLLVYANWAQGFRDGGVNGGLPVGCVKAGVPAQFVPDTLTNWELGWKSTLLGGHLQWNGALYYMPWKNLQTVVFDPTICPSSSFNANVGDARVYGAETDVKYQPSAFLSVGFSASYNDSELTSNTYNTPSFPVSPGERLPYVPYLDFSGNARYERPLSDRFKGYVQYDIAHKGDMWNDLAATSNGLPRVLQPGYSVMNLRFGLDQTEGQWMTELYITNLTNKNAVIYTNEGNFDLRYTRNEPRVFGARVSYRWGKRGAGGE
jgi:iron complex outermembrane recepter protein